MKIIRPTAITDEGGSFTRSTTATYTDSTGVLQTAAINVPRVDYKYNTTKTVPGWECKGVLLEQAATNLLLRSQELSTAPWTLNIATVTPNATTAPDNTATAETLTANGANSFVGQVPTYASGTLVTFSVFLKNINSPSSTLMARSTLTSAQINIVWTGSILTSIDITVGTGVVVGFEPAGNGWYRVYMTYTSGEANQQLRIYPDYSTNNSSIYAWGTQLEAGATYTSYIPTTTATVTRAADVCNGDGFIYSNVGEQYPTWVSGTTYALGDKVTRSTTQAVYVRIVAGAGTTAPESDTTNWALVSNEYPLWVSGTTYTLGQRVTRDTSTTHSVYERVVAGAGTTPPENDAVNWLRAGPTNRWAVFDDSPSTLSSNTDTITYIIKPGKINSIALLELEGTEVAINMYADGALQFSAYNDLLSNDNVGNWYEYFYEPFYYQTSLAITDLINAALLDMPMYTNTIITVTIRKPYVTTSIGCLVLGIVYELGKTQNGMNVGIIDYSRKDTDTYGNTILVRRKFSRRIRASFFLYSSKVDTVSNLLTQYRATPVVWIAADSLYSSLVVYGFYRDWDIGIPNNIGSTCSIEIEGLT